jgi:predicted nucleic acid-binding protein
VTRVVIDTNVLVSAAIGHGKPRRLLRLVLRGHTAVASLEMLAELADVLAREKFSLTPRQISRFLTIYTRRSEVFVPLLTLIPRPRPTAPSNRLTLAPESTNAVVANQSPRGALNCNGMIGKAEPLKGA